MDRRRPSRERVLREAAPRAFAWRPTTRGVVAILIGGALAVGCAMQSLSLGFRGTRPELALMMNADDPVALAGLAAKGLHKDRSRSERSVSLARESLRHQLLNPQAVFVLGWRETAQTKRGQVLAETAMVEQLTRRHKANQLWLVELAARRRDIPQVVRLLDALLRHADGLNDTIYPILAQALDDPRAIAELRKPLTASAWAVPFIDYAAEYGNPVATANMLLALAPAKVEAVHPAARGKVLGKLVAAGEISAARRLFGTVSAGRTAPEPLAAVNLDQQLAPFTWQLLVTDRIWTKPASKDGGIAIEVTSTNPTMAARRLMFLAPGRHQVRWELDGADGIGMVDVAHTCFEPAGGRMRMRSDIVPARSSGRSTAEMVIPAGCAAQYVMIRAQAADDRQSGIVTVRRISFAR